MNMITKKDDAIYAASAARLAAARHENYRQFTGNLVAQVDAAVSAWNGSGMDRVNFLEEMRKLEMALLAWHRLVGMAGELSNGEVERLAACDKIMEGKP